ncbi:hypothetical protein [Coleofasciculus sp. G1-WW12-02]|uniref:hypothetical protein n=1 Tax=Coleofasciculus sp. G1-WW12-02 TaxID=3068483 RepID=UPI004063E604
MYFNSRGGECRELLRQQCHLISFDGKVACIGIHTKTLLKLVEEKLPNIQAAFKNVCHSDIKVSFKVAAPDKD